MVRHDTDFRRGAIVVSECARRSRLRVHDPKKREGALPSHVCGIQPSGCETTMVSRCRICCLQYAGWSLQNRYSVRCNSRGDPTSQTTVLVDFGRAIFARVAHSWHYRTLPKTLWLISATVMPPSRRFPSCATCVMMVNVVATAVVVAASKVVQQQDNVVGRNEFRMFYKYFKGVSRVGDDMVLFCISLEGFS